MFDKIKKFFNDVYVEMQKVAWPSKEELIGSTTVVIIMSVAMAIFSIENNRRQVSPSSG